jgi:hypothetical protein
VNAAAVEHRGQNGEFGINRMSPEKDVVIT